jgi:TonB family protein
MMSKTPETVAVTASVLNVRSEADAEAEVLLQVKRGTLLEVLEAGESWTRVRTSNGVTGWVATRFIGSPSAVSASASSSPRTRGRPSKTRGGCESDFAFLEAPTLRFSDSGAHGLVVIEANVSSAGKVTSAKVISNSTGDDSLGFLAVKEIESAKFAPPMRNCVPRAFVYTYRRTY